MQPALNDQDWVKYWAQCVVPFIHDWTILLYEKASQDDLIEFLLRTFRDPDEHPFVRSEAYRKMSKWAELYQDATYSVLRGDVGDERRWDTFTRRIVWDCCCKPNEWSSDFKTRMLSMIGEQPFNDDEVGHLLLQWKNEQLNTSASP